MHARSPYVHRLTGAILVASIAVGCADLTQSTTVDPVTSASATAAAPSVDAAACAVQTPAGPDDRVPGPGDLMDVSDLGNGRWRLCLTEPVAFEVEGSALCTWAEDRSEVREAAGLPIELGPGSSVDGGIAIDRGAVHLTSNDQGMISAWEGTPADMEAIVGVAGRSGTVSFLIPAIIDPEHPPPVRPPDAAGTISWLCGAPPPPA